MNRVAILLLPLLTFSTALRAQHPVDPDATAAARALLTSLYDLAESGRRWTGQHNFPDSVSEHTRYVEELTGRTPTLYGSDLNTMNGNTRDSVIAECIRRHRAGQYVTLMWHAGRPDDAYRYDQDLHVKGRVYTEEWEDLITPGTDVHSAWLQQVDHLATYLRRLQRVGVPVLWRPYHEMNGYWFWWGDRPGDDGYIRLWKMLYDRLVDEHELHNLVWVWNAHVPVDGEKEVGDFASSGLADFYPGPEYVDVLATDVYNGDFSQDHYEALVQLAGGKPIALGEIGTLPEPEVWEKQPLWAWFMIWPEHLKDENIAGAVRAAYGRGQHLSVKQ